MMADRVRPPVAVVALGDPRRGDEALPLRAMTRARTLIGEIGRLRSAAPPPALPETAAGAAPLVTSGLALAAPEGPPGAVVEWIEGDTQSTRLDAVLEGRSRVVLIDVVRFDAKPGTVFHWSLSDPSMASEVDGLTVLKHYSRHQQLGFDHLAFWLEDDLPPGGLDLIGIEPKLLTGDGLSAPIRRRLPAISSQVAAILLRILAEEGW